MINAWKRFKTMAAFAFSSFISFCQVNTYYWSGNGKENWLWITLGVLLGLVAIYELIIVAKNSNGNSGSA
jgi:hypothetical protein